MAFSGRRHLLSIQTHDGLEDIEDAAFQHCYSLRSIQLTGVKTISDGAFNDCSQLEDVVFDKLEYIGNWAFAHTALRTIKLPKVTVIEDRAFYNCQQLTDAQLSEDLEVIYRRAFQDCPSLRHIRIPLKNGIFDGNVFNDCFDLSQVDLVGGIHKTVSSLLLESWKNDMNHEIECINQWLPSLPAHEKTATIRQWMERVLERIEHYKAEHCVLLKESMTLLELALWKAKLDDNVDDYGASREGGRITRGQRKRARKDSCITSGASIVIKNVLPFLKLE
jgi:hypothetical protein